MKNLLLFLLISATLHLMFIIFMPSFDIIKSYDNVTPIYVEVATVDFKPLQKSLPERSAEPEPELKPQTNTVDNNKVENKTERKVEKPLPPSGANKPLILPDIAIPKSATDTIKDIALPDVVDIPLRDNPATFKGPNIDSELKSLDTARKSGALSNKDSQSDNLIATGSDVGTGVFDFDVKPSNNRRVLYAPKSPEFALTRDTKIKIKFSIDRSGATRNIQFVTRSEQAVEELARDYVSKLRFNSVAYDEPDTTQITLTFKVGR